MESFEVDQERVEYWRQTNHDAAASEDGDLPADQKRDREEVIPGSNLKRDDKIMLGYAIPLHVIGPGRGIDVILGYYPDWFGDQAMTFELTPHEIVTDRLPFDEEEDPMPVFPEPEQRLGAQQAAVGTAGAADREKGKDAKARVFKQFLKAQPPETRKALKKALKQHGHAELLDKDDHD